MAYYWKCELCGSNLDPCERCNCKKEIAVSMKNKSRPQTLKLTIPHAYNSGMGLYKKDYQTKGRFF